MLEEENVPQKDQGEDDHAKIPALSEGFADGRHRSRQFFTESTSSESHWRDPKLIALSEDQEKRAGVAILAARFSMGYRSIRVYIIS